MHRNKILPTPKMESFKSTAKSTELLIAYFLWLKIAGLYDFNIPKTENTSKTCHHFLFKILFIFNVLSHVSITIFCLFILFIFPIKQGLILSLITLMLCLGFALGRLITYICLRKYFRVLSDHLLRSQSEHSETDDQSKGFHFTFCWPIFILACPIAIIFALFVSGIAIAVSSHWESRCYIFLKLSLHILIVQAITQQIAVLFLLIGICFESVSIIKKICESVKDLTGMNGESLGHYIRSLCYEYSDFIVLMDKLDNNANLIIPVLTLTLGGVIYITASYRHHIDIFEICELGILVILGICAMIAVIVALEKLVDNKNGCKFHLISIELDRIPEEFKIDLSIFQERIFQSSISLVAYMKTLPPLVMAFLIYQLKASFD